jgi:phytoene dehydrogenase-like protein
MHDAIVIGSGPNGLAGATALALRGWDVLLLEAKSRPGGALYSEAFTLPGFVHDVGAAFFPFADLSPVFRALDLTATGLEWRNATIESCHPAPDGSCASISRDVERSVASFGVDGPAWRKLATWMAGMSDRLAEALLSPLPSLGPAWRLGLPNLVKFGIAGMQTAAGWSRRAFRTEAARRIVPGLALHVDLGPEDFAGAGLGIVLALLASASGFRVPVGGARAITEAMLNRFKYAGGELRLDTHVDRIIVREGRAVAIRTDDGDEIEVRHAVLADVGPAALFLRMLDEDAVPGGVRVRAREFRYGWGTFKMDWALSGPVPWSAAEGRAAAVVHAGDSLDDLIAFTNQARAGELPDNPYLVIGQQSLVDPTRAPAGGHTLWAYSRVPSRLPGGWAAERERFADRIEARIEGLAPGFRALIQGRAIHAPPDLEAMDENLVGGDLGGGSAQIDQQLFLRPVFPYFRYATPVRGLYLASASTHPGAGVHGACGWNAAQRALRDAGV